MSIPADGRARNWTFIVYPDSAPENWRDLIDEQHVEWACSPLHDADINGDGSKKKPHWHVIVCFPGKKSFEQIIDCFCTPCNCPIPQICNSKKGTVRYFVHIDNPDKAQYKIEDIRCYGGFDLADAFAPTASMIMKISGEMVEFIFKYGITEFADFAIFCRRVHPEDWYYVLTTCRTTFFDKFLHSRRYSSNSKDVIIKDPVTGEVIFDSNEDK